MKKNEGVSTPGETSHREVPTNLEKAKSPKSSPAKSDTSSDTIIAYVHSISPVKRNQKNTMDYSTLVLQTGETSSQKALLYSKHKRPLLAGSEKSHTPAKIARYTYTTNGDKTIINDMTRVSFPNQSEYSFQYAEQPNEMPYTTSIGEILSSCSEWDSVTLCGKAIRINESTNVASGNLTVAQALFTDTTGIIKVDLWEQNISKVEIGNVYQISPVQVRVWSDTKKLSTVISTVITPVSDNQNLNDLQVPSEKIESTIDTVVVKEKNISLLDKVEYFIQCAKPTCQRKILQDTCRAVVSCDRCGGSMCLADCSKKICVRIVVLPENQKELRLTAFENTLQNVIAGELHSLTQSEIAEVLLLLEDITITYNSTSMIVIKIS